MKTFLVRMLWVVPMLSGLLGMSVGTAMGHEERETAEYRFNVGWINEPAYEGFINGVELRVSKLAPENDSADGGGHHDESDSDAGDIRSLSEGTASTGGLNGGVPVTGLEETLQVEVTHVASAASVILDLYPDRFDPGRYTADLIPTAPGVYEFRIFGFIERELIDQSFLSMGGGGGFDDIRPSAGLQFPEEVAGPRELESAMRGALDAAQQAQDIALAASEDDDESGSGVMVIAVIALALGGLGLVAGVGGLWIVLRKR